MSWGSLHFPFTPNLSLEPPLFRKAYRKWIGEKTTRYMVWHFKTKPRKLVAKKWGNKSHVILPSIYQRTPLKTKCWTQKSTSHKLYKVFWKKSWWPSRHYPRTPNHPRHDWLHDRWRERLLRHRPCGDDGWHWGTLGWCGLGAPGMLFGWFFWRKKWRPLFEPFLFICIYICILVYKYMSKYFDIHIYIYIMHTLRCFSV